MLYSVSGKLLLSMKDEVLLGNSYFYENENDSCILLSLGKEQNPSWLLLNQCALFFSLFHNSDSNLFSQRQITTHSAQMAHYYG